MLSLADLQKGQRAIIERFSITQIPIKLLEMGCLPGNEVSLIQKAPFKDPLYFNLNGSHLAIRRDTAKYIEVSLIS